MNGDRCFRASANRLPSTTTQLPLIAEPVDYIATVQASINGAQTMALPAGALLGLHSDPLNLSPGLNTIFITLTTQPSYSQDFADCAPTVKTYTLTATIPLPEIAVLSSVWL